MHKLEIHRQGSDPRQLVLDGEVTIGRGAENVVSLDGAAVSGEHAKVVLLEDACYLFDLESRNGTLVDGQLVEPGVAFPLEGGERISVGAYQITYVSEQMARRPTGDTIDDMDVLPPPGRRSKKTTIIAAVTLIVCVAALASIVIGRVL